MASVQEAMMQIEEGLYSFLMARQEVTNLISTRLYPVMIPQEATQPAAGYQRISGTRETVHGEGLRLATARVQITVTANDYESCKGVAQAIREVCHGYRGVWGTVRVHRCAVENEMDGWNMSSKQATVRLDLVVMYRE